MRVVREHRVHDIQLSVYLVGVLILLASLHLYMLARVSYRIFCLGGEFSRASNKHVNAGGSGGIPPGNIFGI